MLNKKFTEQLKKAVYYLFEKVSIALNVHQIHVERFSEIFDELLEWLSTPKSKLDVLFLLYYDNISSNKWNEI